MAAKMQDAVWTKFKNEKDYEKKLILYKATILPYLEAQYATSPTKVDLATKLADAVYNKTLSQTESDRARNEFDGIFNQTFKNPTEDQLGTIEKRFRLNRDLGGGANTGIANPQSSIKRLMEASMNANVESWWDRAIGSGDYQTVEEAIEAAAKGDIAALKSARAGRGEDSDSVISKAEELSLRQCALMSILYNVDGYLLYGRVNNDGDPKDPIPWNGRIMGFLGSKTSNAAELPNYFYGDENIKSYYETKTEMASFARGLFYVYEDGSSNTMKEVNLKLSTNEFTD